MSGCMQGEWYSDPPSSPQTPDEVAAVAPTAPLPSFSSPRGHLPAVRRRSGAFHPAFRAPPCRRDVSCGLGSSLRAAATPPHGSGPLLEAATVAPWPAIAATATAVMAVAKPAVAGIPKCSEVNGCCRRDAARTTCVAEQAVLAGRANTGGYGLVCLNVKGASWTSRMS